METCINYNVPARKKSINRIISFLWPRLAQFWWKRASGAKYLYIQKSEICVRGMCARDACKTVNPTTPHPIRTLPSPIQILTPLSYTPFHSFTTHILTA